VLTKYLTALVPQNGPIDKTMRTAEYQQDRNKTKLQQNKIAANKIGNRRLALRGIKQLQS